MDKIILILVVIGIALTLYGWLTSQGRRAARVKKRTKSSYWEDTP